MNKVFFNIITCIRSPLLTIRCVSKDSNGYEKVNDNDNVIRLSDLEGEIAEQRRINEEKVIRDWMKCITHDYIRSKIVEAAAQCKTQTILIDQCRFKSPGLDLSDLYGRYRIGEKISMFLEPPMRVYTLGSTNCFEIIISWSTSTCQIL